MSNSLFSNWPLIAQLPILRVSKSVREHDPNEGLLSLAIVIAAVILLGTGIAAIYYWFHRRPRRIHNPRRLFHDLCQAHHLTAIQRKQLCNFAQRLNVSQPSLLFLDDSLWNLEQLAQDEKTISPKDLENLKKLNRTLFAPVKTKPTKSSLAQLVN